MKNHNPAAQNGSQSAWDILSPFWDSSSTTYIRSTVAEDMSWVNYNTGGFGQVVDRFRWEAGCIAEHVSHTYSPRNASQLLTETQWDQGEEYPAT